MEIDLTNLTITKTHEHIKARDFSVSELVSAYLSVIKEKNPEINSYLEVYDDTQEQAKQAQEKIQSGEGDVLTGIPIALKDNLLVKGRYVSASSKVLEGYKATYTATAVKKLIEKGAVLLGRTNMDEFAMGSSTETSAFGVTRNPTDNTRVPGGSSGGSAAAVAMNGALAALGSDTGGSIRQPASFCGCVGLKPTYGAVSRYGLMAMGSSLDIIGPITKTVADAEIIFEAIHGKDSYDSTSISEDTYKVPLKKEYIIGVPREALNADGLARSVKNNFKESVETLENLGCKVKEVSLPNVSYALASYYVLVPAEVSSNLARFDGVRYGLHKEGENLLDDYFKTRGEGFGLEARRRIMLGTYVLSAGYYDAYYNKANAARKLIVSDFEKVFKKVDVVITPTTPTPAFKIGEKINNPLSMYLADIFTVTANITGIPALSVPSGISKEEGKDLPLGLQLMAPLGGENRLFEIGAKFLKE